MALSFLLIGPAGKFIRHALRVLLRCWRRMLRAGMIAGFVSLLATETLASLATHHFPPAIPAHIVAGTLALVVTYSVALTVFAFEFLTGLLDIIPVLEGDAQAGLRMAAIIAGRDAAAVSRGAAPQRGPSRYTTPSPAANPARTSDARDATSGAQTETLRDIQATEEFTNTSPHPRVAVRPVPAEQLPRIEWTWEHPAVKPPASSTTGPVPAPASSSSSSSPQEQRLPPIPVLTPPPVSAPSDGGARSSERAPGDHDSLG